MFEEIELKKDIDADIVRVISEQKKEAFAPVESGEQSEVDIPFGNTETVSDSISILSPEQEIERIWKSEYEKLSIDGVDDKNNYFKVKRGISLLKNTRVAIDKIRKEKKIPLKNIINFYDERADALIDILKPKEEILRGKIEAIDTEKEKIKIEKQKAATQLYEQRSSKLIAAGCRSNGISFVIDGANFDVMLEEIKALSDKEFEEIVSEAESIIKRLAQEKAAEEEKKIAATRISILETLGFIEINGIFERQNKSSIKNDVPLIAVRKESIGTISDNDFNAIVKNVRADSEKLIAEQKEREDALLKEQKELEDKRKKFLEEQGKAEKKIIEFREKQIEAIGFIKNTIQGQKGVRFTIELGYGIRETIVVEQLGGVEDDFKEELSSIKDKVVELRGMEQVKKIEDEQLKAKEAQAAADREFARIQQEVKDKRAREIKEAEQREALKSDKEKLSDFADKLSSLEYPVLNNEKAKGFINAIENQIKSISENIRKEIIKL